MIGIVVDQGLGLHSGLLTLDELEALYKASRKSRLTASLPGSC